MGIKYYSFKRKNINSTIKNYQKIISNLRKSNNPVICEFEILTLGSYKSENNIINYHHGPMKIKTNNVFVHNNDDDILFLINKKLNV